MVGKARHHNHVIPPILYPLSIKINVWVDDSNDLRYIGLFTPIDRIFKIETDDNDMVTEKSRKKISEELNKVTQT